MVMATYVDVELRQTSGAVENLRLLPHKKSNVQKGYQRPLSKVGTGAYPRSRHTILTTSMTRLAAGDNG